jgi:hypothetical protein
VNRRWQHLIKKHDGLVELAREFNATLMVTGSLVRGGEAEKGERAHKSRPVTPNSTLPTFRPSAKHLSIGQSSAACWTGAELLAPPRCMCTRSPVGSSTRSTSVVTSKGQCRFLAGVSFSRRHPGDHGADGRWPCDALDQA